MSIITDEMTGKAIEKYDKNLQKFLGAVDLVGVTSNESIRLANKMLIFMQVPSV